VGLLGGERRDEGRLYFPRTAVHTAKMLGDRHPGATARSDSAAFVRGRAMMARGGFETNGFAAMDRETAHSFASIAGGPSSNGAGVPGQAASSGKAVSSTRTIQTQSFGFIQPGPSSSGQDSIGDNRGIRLVVGHQQQLHQCSCRRQVLQARFDQWHARECPSEPACGGLSSASNDFRRPHKRRRAIADAACFCLNRLRS